MKASRNLSFFVAGVLAIFGVGALLVVSAAGDDAGRRASARACEMHAGECTIEVPGTTPVKLDNGTTITPTVTIPPLDPAAAAVKNDNSSWAQGRRIYLREGCAVCHTQQVRPVLSDLGLGPASQPGDYAFQDPAPLGTERVGPDLADVGTRSPFTKCDAVVNYLKNPRSVHSWSTSPNYAYLPQGDLADLATYVTHLRPAGTAGPISCSPAELPAATDTVTPTVSGK